MIHFTSDPHYFHKNILHLCDRPFADVEEMHETLINNWNSRVSNEDEVYILGDVSFGPLNRTIEIMNKLCGKKYLVHGNHDKVILKNLATFKDIFEWVKPYWELNTNDGRKIVLFHYPISSWNGFHRGWIHLHGHTHSRFNDLNSPNLIFDVGVDANWFAPISLEEILNIMKIKKNVRSSYSS